MKRFLVNIPDDLKLFLKKQAQKKGHTLNALIRQILWEWKENSGGENKWKQQ